LFRCRVFCPTKIALALPGEDLRNERQDAATWRNRSQACADVLAWLAQPLTFAFEVSMFDAAQSEFALASNVKGLSPGSPLMNAARPE
jgi:hypothetical protein